MHIISETRGFISALFNGSTAVLTVVFAQNVPRSKRRLELSHRQPPAREDQEPPCNGAKHQNGIADEGIGIVTVVIDDRIWGPEVIWVLPPGRNIIDGGEQRRLMAATMMPIMHMMPVTAPSLRTCRQQRYRCGQTHCC